MKFTATENTEARDMFLAKARDFLGRPREGIHISDLVLPRRAYYRAKYPDLGLSEDEVGFFLAGRGHHHIIQFLATLPEFREVRVQLEAIKGRVDILEELPIEIKTTRVQEMKTIEELIKDSHHYFEQLGFYCAAADRSKGQLWIFYLGIREENKTTRIPKRTSPKLVVYDVEFEDIAEIKREMLKRRLLLDIAVLKEDPSGLPLCPTWLCRRCKFADFCRADQNRSPKTSEPQPIA